MTIVLANGSYRDTIETEISRLYSDLYETELEKMRSPEMRKCLSRVKGEDGMLSTERGYSVIERIKAEGRNEGLNAGRNEGKREAAVKMIAAGFPSSIISSITDIPIGEIEKLRKNS